MENYVKDCLKEEILNEFAEYGKKVDEVDKNGVWVYRFLVKYSMKTREERLEYLKKVLQEEAGENDVLIFKEYQKYLEVYVGNGEYRVNIPYKLVNSLSIREVKETGLEGKTELEKDKEVKVEKFKDAERVLKRVKEIVLLEGKDKEERIKEFKKEVFMVGLANKEVDLRKLEDFKGTNRELINTAKGIVKSTEEELDESIKRVEDWEEKFEEEVEKVKGISTVNKLYEAGYDLRIFVGGKTERVINYYRDEDVGQ